MDRERSATSLLTSMVDVTTGMSNISTTQIGLNRNESDQASGTKIDEVIPIISNQQNGTRNDTISHTTTIVGAKEDVKDENEVNVQEASHENGIDQDYSRKLITSYNILKGHKYLHSFDSLPCDNNVRQAISPKFTQSGAFDFQVEISTSQRILYMGDSVGIQFSQSLQDATGAKPQDRKVLRFSWGNHEGIHIASPIRGGGAVAGWRITGMFREEMMNEYKSLPNYYGGGWMNGDAKNLKRALAYMTEIKNQTDVSNPSCEIKKGVSTSFVQERIKIEKRGENCPEEKFDVIVHQFPFGWLKKPTADKITFESIHEAVTLSKQQFGAKTIILQTIPVNNNVIDMIEELETINNRIMNYTKTAQKTGIESVLLLDLGQLSIEMFAHNAAAMRLIPLGQDEIDQSMQSNTISEVLNPLLTHRTVCCNKDYGQIIAYTCSRNRQSTNRIKDCFKTRYSRDGMHFCMDEVGGRINGGVACLLKCVETQNDSLPKINDCENRCNERFMSLESLFPSTETTSEI